mmetsp:Transcript_145412/g.205868  ORF Transcript_145412/g.205868 Transcript_145412/m.205868 type:complete len:117 (-) Transcript_145412:622-972(-)
MPCSIGASQMHRKKNMLMVRKRKLFKHSKKRKLCRPAHPSGLNVIHSAQRCRRLQILRTLWALDQRRMTWDPWAFGMQAPIAGTDATVRVRVPATADRGIPAADGMRAMIHQPVVQ